MSGTMIRIVVRAFVSLVAATLVVCAVAGCSEPREEPAVSREDDSDAEAVAEQTPSRAAAARGLPAKGDDTEAKRPVVTLEDVTYEWRLFPDKGLVVSLEFGNPNVVFERARAYVFVVADFSERRTVNRGVFPLGAEFDEAGPVDYTAGTHILYRKDHTMQCFIPYTHREGYYDSLTVIVYSEDGEKLLQQSYDLDVAGEPTGRVEMKPVLTL
ncbi:MAG: hypothetical protein ABIG03_00650 [Candidatus Eisenbacteria bacterium]